MINKVLLSTVLVLIFSASCTKPSYSSSGRKDIGNGFYRYELEDGSICIISIVVRGGISCRIAP